jgi:hypothetical protein
MLFNKSVDRATRVIKWRSPLTRGLSLPLRLLMMFLGAVVGMGVAGGVMRGTSGMGHVWVPVVFMTVLALLFLIWLTINALPIFFAFVFSEALLRMWHARKAAKKQAEAQAGEQENVEQLRAQAQGTAPASGELYPDVDAEALRAELEAVPPQTSPAPDDTLVHETTRAAEAPTVVSPAVETESVDAALAMIEEPLRPIGGELGDLPFDHSQN